MQIKFQTALITGSSRGLGRQIALKLAAEGVRKIAIHYRTGRSDAETTLSLIESAGASGVLVQGDVADPVAAESLVKEAAQKLGGCDIFVHSVCPPLGEIYEHVMATELSVEKWQLAFDTQARAFFIGARTAAKFMRGGGRIIGMFYSQSGRTGGWQPWVGMGSAKAAAWDYGEDGDPWNVGYGGESRFSFVASDSVEILQITDCRAPRGPGGRGAPPMAARHRCRRLRFGS